MSASPPLPERSPEGSAPGPEPGPQESVGEESQVRGARLRDPSVKRAALTPPAAARQLSGSGLSLAPAGPPGRSAGCFRLGREPATLL